MNEQDDTKLWQILAMPPNLRRGTILPARS